MTDNGNHSIETARDLSPLMDGEALDPRAVVQHAKAVAQVVDELASFALQLTEPRHWVAYKENDGPSHPWLTGPGAEMMISKLSLKVEYEGAGFEVERFEFDLPNGGKQVQLLMTCKLRVSIPNWASIVSEGHCTTTDAFFSRGGRLGVHEVDLGNLRQAAYTNALSNAVTRLLGIRRMTWEDVKRITRGKVEESKVESASFKRGGKGGASKGQADKPATKEQRTSVWVGFCAGMGNLDPKAPPPGLSDTFYAWVTRHLGAEKRDKEKWTEADVKRLLDEAKQLAQPQVPDEPPAPEDAPPPAADEMP